MFARITRIEVSGGAWDEFEESYRRGLEGGDRVAGLVGRFLAHCASVDGAEVGYAISLWASIEDAKAYEGGEFFAERFRGQLGSYFVAEPVTESGMIQLIETYG